MSHYCGFTCFYACSLARKRDLFQTFLKSLNGSVHRNSFIEDKSLQKLLMKFVLTRNHNISNIKAAKVAKKPPRLWVKAPCPQWGLLYILYLSLERWVQEGLGF